MSNLYAINVYDTTTGKERLTISQLTLKPVSLQALLPKDQMIYITKARISSLFLIFFILSNIPATIDI